MHRYRVEFSARRLDESRLRDLLHREFGVRIATITRDAPGIAPSDIPAPRNELQHEILQLLADGKPWRRKAIISALSTGATEIQVTRALVSLIRRSAISTIRHGVYAIATAEVGPNTEIAPLERKEVPPTEKRIVELLAEARTAPFLKEALGVSRQRVEQLLKKLMKSGKVVRLEAYGEQGSHLYICAENMSAMSISGRNPTLKANRIRIISCLAPETIVNMADVCTHASINKATITRYTEDLASNGLISLYHLGKKKYAAITPKGLHHPQYKRDAQKAPGADVIGDYGEERARFIETLAALGNARTIDVTDALPDGERPADTYSSGQIVQRLTNGGIFERVDPHEQGQPHYRLTTHGEMIAGVIARIRQKPDPQILRQRIAERRGARIDSIKKRYQSESVIDSNFNSGVNSIIRALRIHGDLRAAEIPKFMDAPYKNPKSVYFALRSLEARGVVTCVVSSGNEKLWRINETDG